ncbi:plasmid replication DNA-binding protein KfrA [Methylorubrum extorquens]
MHELRKKELFEAADKLFASTGRVSLRTLIPLLSKGGSNREVGPALVEWKAARGYAPALKVKELPVPLQAALAKVASGLWEAAQAEAAARLTRDRENMAVTLRASEEVLAEALHRLDAAEAEIAALRESLARAETRLDGSEARLTKLRSEEFWDRVMREIYGILPVKGTMNAAQILRLLKPETVRGAAEREEPLTPRTLHKKLVGRAEQGWYVEAETDGHFSRGTFPTLGRRKEAAPIA